jgi:hypothetical protein
MIDEDLRYNTKHMCFSFNVDEPAEVIYEELESKADIMDYDLETYGKTPTFKNWTMDDFKRFYEETKNDRDILVKKLNEMFCVEWYKEPTAKPKVTLKRDEFPLMMFDHIYKLHSFGQCTESSVNSNWLCILFLQHKELGCIANG